jgi:FtsP/CotA-like multicopper oxidase with cupredoxin domain
MLTRRRLLEGTGAMMGAALIGRSAARAQEPRFETALPIPELRDARAHNGAIQLVAAQGRHAFFPGEPTTTYGFSAPCLGPVLRLHKGDDVEVSVENRLVRDTTAHWHGVLVPAESMAGRMSSLSRAAPGARCSGSTSPKPRRGIMRIRITRPGCRSTWASPGW